MERDTETVTQRKTEDKDKETDWSDRGGSYPGRPPGVAKDGVRL